MVGQEKIIEKLKKMKMNYLKQERGSILVLSVILLPILFAFLGFGYDFGNIYMHKSRLQNVADAAALAGARAYLDSQATDNKDGIDGTVDRANGKLTADSSSSDKTGRTTEYEYVPGVVTYHNHCNSGNIEDVLHSRADKAADEYISRNIINLGSKVKSDKWSHYAINSDGAAPKTFYRIGLYEEVPLYFLPIIKSVGKTQIVRAGAIALVVPGKTETTSTPGSGGSSETSFSIFNNLFTYTDYLFTRNTIVDDPEVASDEFRDKVRAGATFTGTIAYTHLNGLTSTAGSNKRDDQFYDAQNPKDNGTNDQYKENHLYNSRDIYFTDPEIKNHINDSVTNTFYNTKEYLEAFQKKLNEPHVDVTQNTLTLEGDGNKDINSTCRATYTLNGSGHYRLDKNINTYYQLDSNGDDAVLVKEGKTYKICYTKFPDSNYYVCCGKIEDDSTYYLLDSNNNISQGKILIDDWNNKKGRIVVNGNDKWLVLEGNTYKWRDIDSWWPSYDVTEQLPTPVQDNAFAQQASSATGKSNIYHFNADLLPNPTDTNITIKINNTIPEADDHSPIYIIIDDNIKNRINIDTDQGNNSSFDSGRPIIIAYSGNCEFHVNLSYATLNLTLYMPNADYDASNFYGTFNGNIIARYINVAAGQTATWIQKNFMEDYYGYNDADIQEVTKKIEKRVRDTNALLDNATITEDGKTLSLKEYISEKLSSNDLKIEVSNLGDMHWYQNLSFSEKQGLYVRWKNLYESKKGDSNFDQNLLNLLWAWNEHFDIDGTQVINTTDETLRLINFRTDYQEMNPDGSENKGERDPFIYLSLDKEAAY